MNKSLFAATLLAAVCMSASAITSVAHVSVAHVTATPHVTAVHVAPAEVHVATPTVKAVAVETVLPKPEAKAYMKPSTVVTPMKPIALPHTPAHTVRAVHSSASAASQAKK